MPFIWPLIASEAAAPVVADRTISECCLPLLSCIVHRNAAAHTEGAMPLGVQQSLAMVTYSTN